MKEADLSRLIQIALSECGARVFRNNSGAFQDKRGQWVRFGVANPGGADLIGFTRNGIFLAVEIKTAKGRATDEQINFINIVNKFGGIGFIARSAEEAVKELALYETDRLREGKKRVTS